MNSFKKVLAGVLLLAPALATHAQPPSQSGLLFQRAGYDYAPAVMRDGNSMDIWWCGSGNNADNIYYRNIDVSGPTYGPIHNVLQPSNQGSNGWDSAHTCDPSVVKGDFVYPLGSSTHYQYAMYYTGTNDGSNGGVNNGIGVAFSNDKINWVKHPTPIYRENYGQAYGIGHQVAINGTGGPAVWLFVLRQETVGGAQHYHLFHSPNGLNLDYQHQISEQGVYGGFITAADFGFDATTSNVYMVTNRLNDEGRLDVYRTPWSAMAAGTWEAVDNVTSADTGKSWNAFAAFLRDPYGSINPWFPAYQLYFGGATSQGSGRPDPNLWDIYWYQKTIAP